MWVVFFKKLRIGKTFETNPNGDTRTILTLAEQCQLALGCITAIMWHGGSHLACPRSACYVRCCLTSWEIWWFFSCGKWQFPSQVMPGAAARCLHLSQAAAAQGKVLLQLYLQKRKWVLYYTSAKAQELPCSLHSLVCALPVLPKCFGPSCHGEWQGSSSSLGKRLVPSGKMTE